MQVGVATIVYGEPRLTQDIDIVTALEPHMAERFVQQFPSSDYYCPPVDAVAGEASRDAFGHFNLLHLETDARADVYIAGKDELAQHAIAHVRIVSLVGLQVPLAPPEYVILHKLRFRQQGASERHLRDVRGILRVLGESIDVVALRHDAERLGLSVAWREMELLRD